MADKNCSNCDGSKYCISKPNKNDYKFPEEENQYLIDLECGIWNCHTAVIKLLKENKLKEEIIIGEQQEIDRLKAQVQEQQVIAMHRIADKALKIVELEEQIEKMKTELHHRLVSPSHSDSDCLDRIISLDRLWQSGQEF